MKDETKTTIYDIFSQLEGSTFILEDVENLLNILDRSISDITRWVCTESTVISTVISESLKETYSLLTAIKHQLAGASKDIQKATYSGYAWCSMENQK